MSKRGTKPQPTALKLIRGNPGKRALPDGEPQLDIEIPDPPAEMSAGAKEYWNQYAERLVVMKVLTDADQSALALLCEATHTFWACMDKVRAQGVVVKIGEKGYATRNPFLTEANTAQKQMLQLLTEFGLTPSSRTRVQTVKADGKGNRFA